MSDRTNLLIFEIISGCAGKKRNGATALVRHQFRNGTQIQFLLAQLQEIHGEIDRDLSSTDRRYDGQFVALFQCQHCTRIVAVVTVQCNDDALLDFAQIVCGANAIE